MNTTTWAIWGLLILAIIAANLPWLSERVAFLFTPKSGHKRAWIRRLEWLAMYFIIGFIALGPEQKLYGEYHPQSWEFYAINFCLFLVFALPGFIYRYDLKPHLAKRR